MAELNNIRETVRQRDAAAAECCAPATLAECCEPDAKGTCCEAPPADARPNCGCQS